VKSETNTRKRLERFGSWDYEPFVSAVLQDTLNQFGGDSRAITLSTLVGRRLFVFARRFPWETGFIGSAQFCCENPVHAELEPVWDFW
jgi:hypothetical protein